MVHRLAIPLAALLVAAVVVLAITSVVREAMRGRLPTQLTTGGLAYEADIAAVETAQRQQRQLDELREQVETLVALTLGDEAEPG